jgi:hypothetical protein
MSTSPKAKSRTTFFELREETDAFSTSVMQMIAKMVRQGAGARIPSENHQVYSHGRAWQHPANEYAATSEMHEQRAEFETSFDDIVHGDFEVIPRMVTTLVTQFNDAMARMMYQNIAEVCEANGQTVDARGRPFAEAFLEMFQKIEFGVDRDGTVSMPELHVGQNPAKLIAELEAMPKEFHEEFKRLKQEKIDKALAEEAARRSKFKTRSE